MQDSKPLTQEETENAAYNLGLIIGALVAGITDGVTASTLDRIAAQVEREEKPPAPWKREIGHISDDEETTDFIKHEDCAFCWCDTCTLIEQCAAIDNPERYKNEPRPFPCIGCEDGMRFKPRAWINGETTPQCFINY